MQARALLIAALLVGLAWPAAAAGLSEKRLIVEAMEYPWSAIGRVNTGGRGHCTGYLIGPRHAMTAAHCLYDAVEGRWRGANELHFVAGYQRDRYIIHASVTGYSRASAFDPANWAKLENIEADWAVLSLAEPIGRQAGWLGLAVLDRGTVADIEAGRAFLAHAGYRRGQSHAMTVSAPCQLLGQIEGKLALAYTCDVSQGDSGAPLMLFRGRHVFGIALQTVQLTRGETVFAGAVSSQALGRRAKTVGVTLPAPGLPMAAGDLRPPGRPPPADSPAGPLPEETIAILLERLGYLSRDSGKSARAAAIRRFESTAGLPQTSAASLLLLGRLLAANGE